MEGFKFLAMLPTAFAVLEDLHQLIVVASSRPSSRPLQPLLLPVYHRTPSPLPLSMAAGRQFFSQLADVDCFQLPEVGCLQLPEVGCLP